jgi:hypothetical protein
MSEKKQVTGKRNRRRRRRRRRKRRRDDSTPNQAGRCQTINKQYLAPLDSHPCKSSRDDQQTRHEDRDGLLVLGTSRPEEGLHEEEQRRQQKQKDTRKRRLRANQTHRASDESHKRTGAHDYDSKEQKQKTTHTHTTYCSRLWVAMVGVRVGILAFLLNKVVESLIHIGRRLHLQKALLKKKERRRGRDVRRE